MALVFSEQLADSWDDAGVTGIVQVWSSALLELIQITLLRLATTPSVIVPAICFALSAFFLGGELMLARAHASAAGVGGLMLAEAIRTVVVLPSVIAALVSLAAVRAAECRRTVSLQLCPARSASV